MKCEGLTGEQLAHRSVPPSSLSLLGLLRHMAELERAYFRQAFMGEDIPTLYYTRDHLDADFDDASPANAQEGLETWRAEVARAREIIAANDTLDAVGGGRPMAFWLVKTLNEYARHNGHADLLRECIDGVTGE